MLLSSSNSTLVHLFTDIHLNVLSGGPTERIACNHNEIAGKSLTQLFAGVAPEVLLQVTQQCLQQPGISHKIAVRMGITGSNRKFSWIVCALKNNAGGAHGLIWIGTENTLKYRRTRKSAVQSSATNVPSYPAETIGQHAGYAKTNKQASLKFGIAANEPMGTGSHFDLPHACNKDPVYLQQRYQVAALISADIIADWDIENDVMWRSNPSDSILVHPQKARSMHERFDRVHTDDRQRFITTLNEALESVTSNWKCEYRYESGTANNRFKILSEHAQVIRNEKGKAVRLISVIHDVTEKRKLEQELRRKEKEVICATIEGQEAERKELSRELHDNVGQVLAMCKLFVEIAAGAVHHEYMDKCHDQLQRAMQEIRNLSHRLSPELLDGKGLPGAIASLTENINGTARLAIELDIDPVLHTTEMEKRVQTTAYRIVQELISNTLKHAHASKTVLRLWPEAAMLMIHLKDDGAGFDPQKVAGGIGLRNIHNRAAIAGGKVEIKSSPGKGCSTLVMLPF